ncbi:MAG: OmpA family protein [Phycisphaerae bacterium]|jgi:chemotaxis protein MotB
MKYSLTALILTTGLLLSGCVSQSDYNGLKMQNDTQSLHISELESQYGQAKLELDQLREQLERANALSAAGKEASSKEVALLEEALAEKNALIEKLQQQLLAGGVKLPAELNVMLEQFASANPEIVTFDQESGVVKFKSDLTFAPGSDSLSTDAQKAIAALCEIMNSQYGQQFDMIIAGHTDDMKISKPSTRQAHPTNWHLSAHRAISVLEYMTSKELKPERLSIRGFGQFRPVAPNAANNKGNVMNRRVEIFIVPRGA